MTTVLQVDVVEIPRWIQEELDELTTVAEAGERLQRLERRQREIPDEIAELERELLDNRILMQYVRQHIERLEEADAPEVVAWRRAMADPRQLKFQWAN